MQSDIERAVGILHKTQSVVASIAQTSEENNTLRIVDEVLVNLKHADTFLASLFNHIRKLPDDI